MMEGGSNISVAACVPSLFDLSLAHLLSGDVHQSQIVESLTRKAPALIKRRAFPFLSGAQLSLIEQRRTQHHHSQHSHHTGSSDHHDDDHMHEDLWRDLCMADWPNKKIREGVPCRRQYWQAFLQESLYTLNALREAHRDTPVDRQGQPQPDDRRVDPFDPNPRALMALCARPSCKCHSLVRRSLLQPFQGRKATQILGSRGPDDDDGFDDTLEDNDINDRDDGDAAKKRWQKNQTRRKERMDVNRRLFARLQRVWRGVSPFDEYVSQFFYSDNSNATADDSHQTNNDDADADGSKNSNDRKYNARMSQTCDHARGYSIGNTHTTDSSRDYSYDHNTNNINSINSMSNMNDIDNINGMRNIIDSSHTNHNYTANSSIKRGQSMQLSAYHVMRVCAPHIRRLFLKPDTLSLSGLARGW